LLTTSLLLMPTASAVCAFDEANYPSKQIRIIVGFAAGGAAERHLRAPRGNSMGQMGQRVRHG
jgi:tripartite-type tricarboxylate transporter receptor subunit TctC